MIVYYHHHDIFEQTYYDSEYITDSFDVFLKQSCVLDAHDITQNSDTTMNDRIIDQGSQQEIPGRMLTLVGRRHALFSFTKCQDRCS